MAEWTLLDEKGRAALRAKLVNGLNETDLRTLCHDLGIRYEDLAGHTFTERVISLVEDPKLRQDFTPLYDWLRDNERGYILADLPTNHHPPTTTPPTRIWNLTAQRNPHFTGREQLLADLRAALTGGGAAALTQTQAITGLGGVGKTQTAVEYAHRHADDYAVVWWVDAAVPETIPNQFAQLAAALDLPEAGAKDLQVAVDAALAWLGGHGGWLLVLDNAERPDDVRPYLPRPLRGHVLVTSRYRAWGWARAVEAPPLPDPEAVQFLLRRTDQTDAASALALARELGGLPLALEQAGAYMQRRTMALAQYLALYRKHHLALLEREKSSQDYPATVATTWALNFEQVEAAMPAAADLLRLCAFLAPDPVPLDLLAAGAEHLPARLGACAADELALPDALGLLGDYSLVEAQADGGRRTEDEGPRTKDGGPGTEDGGRKTEDGGPAIAPLTTAHPPLTTAHQPPTTVLSVHRLVQAVTRGRLDAEATRTWAEAAVRVVNAAYPGIATDYRNWPDCERLLPHALQAAEYSEAEGVAGEATGRLLNQVAVYLRGRAQYQQAKLIAERRLRLAEKEYGLEHPGTAIAHNVLGLVLQNLGDLTAARAHFERALRIGEAVYGPDHPTVATRLNNLGLVLQDLGDLPAARAHYQRALRIDEQVYGPDHPAVATDVNNLGNVLQDLGDLPAARAHYERALRIDEKVYGPDHPDVATDLNNLGLALRDLGDLPAARAHYERALRIRQEKLGPDHPAVANSLNNLGGVLQDLGDLPAARAHYQRALHISEAVYGSDHPDVATDLNNLGGVLRDLGDLPAARAHYERALRIRQEKLGPDHPAVANSLNNLGGVLYALGDLPAARAHYQRALRIFEKVLGEDHPNVATLVNNLGGVLRDLGDLPAARAHLERALRIGEATLGPHHPEVAVWVNNLGEVLRALGDLPAARAHYQRALRIWEDRLGQDHPQVAIGVNNLGSVLRALGDLPAAHAHFERALRILETTLGPDHPKTRVVRGNLEGKTEDGGMTEDGGRRTEDG